ncbi:hypothetical protein Tco_0228283 [Tanacetum coccineum]
MESLNSNSQEREMHQLQQMQDKAKEKCMESFRLLHSHLKVLSIKGGFERACVALFDQDNQTFTESLLLNLDNLEKQLDREEFQETESIGAFRASLGSSFKSPLRGLKSVHLGKLHTKAVVVQKEFGDKILVPVPDLSQRPFKIEKICLDCGDPVHGLYCRQCALIRKTLEEVFQDFQDTSKSSNDDTKLWLIKAISLSKQDPGVNSSQSPQINHNCCYECGDSLDDIFCQRCTSFKEHSETIIDSNDDSTSSDDDSYENIDYVDASPPDAEIVSLEVVEIVIPEVGGIDTDILLTIKDDILREKLLNVNLLIANIEALKDNPAPSSDVMTNGSTTTHSDYSLPDYEAFYFDDDHIEEKSSGSTTTHADFSQYDSFIFDLSINPFPPADRSDFYHEEFADELAHIISPSEYDHFCFKIEPELGNLTMDVVEDIFPTREPRVHVPNVLSTHPTLDTDFILLSEPLFAYIVWIFLPFLTIDQGGIKSVSEPVLLRTLIWEIELENSQNNALAKLPMLKLGEYEMWEIRIKQYFQIQDYALWEVIENGNSWVPIPVTTPESGPSTALKMTVPSTTEENICKKMDDLSSLGGMMQQEDT